MDLSISFPPANVPVLPQSTAAAVMITMLTWMLSVMIRHKLVDGFCSITLGQVVVKVSHYDVHVSPHQMPEQRDERPEQSPGQDESACPCQNKPDTH